MNILAVNAGSSSLRLASFDRASPGAEPVATRRAREPAGAADPGRLRRFAEAAGGAQVDVVAHRVVHGGDEFTEPVRVDAGVERAIERLGRLAPLHNPLALAWIRAARAAFGRAVAHVAQFDTAFFARLPEAARAVALPQDVARRLGIRRYGFHGLAHASMWRALRTLRPDLAGDGRAVTLQLGSGCSGAALRGGVALETTMGFTPLEGLIMATRSGSLDPAAVLLLQQADGLTPAQVHDLLNHRSGLLGLSGRTGDMAALLSDGGPDAERAIDVWCGRVLQAVGALAASLGGLDAMVFGGGIGENAPAVRRRVVAGLEFLGIALDPAANDALAGEPPWRIGRAASIELLVARVDEERELADATAALT